MDDEGYRRDVKLRAFSFSYVLYACMLVCLYDCIYRMIVNVIVVGRSSSIDQSHTCALELRVRLKFEIELWNVSLLFA